MLITIFRPLGLLLGMSLLATGMVNAQKLKKADKALVAALEAHVTFLASDKLEGRRTGTPGEEKAAAYIAGEFEKKIMALTFGSHETLPLEIHLITDQNDRFLGTVRL